MLFGKGIEIMGKLLRVEKLCKNGILTNVSFCIDKGEMVAIMGPSGSGKSTLLYNVAGMDSPSSGNVWLNENKISSISEDKKAELRLYSMGFVFQQMNMISNLNIIDNIMLPSIQANKKKKFKVSKEQILLNAKTHMEKMRISNLSTRSITQISGGELQRACICRSMINNPLILFADEPTGALNKSAAESVMVEFEKINNTGTTILLVTHDSKVASRCKRIIYLSDGVICDELQLSNFKNYTKFQREQEVNKWLLSFEW